MQLSNAPGKLLLPFANAGAKNTIPTASQIGITAGAASLTDGFPPLTRTPIAAGGVPPSGLDMNGILYALSAALRWAAAGGGYAYDAAFDMATFDTRDELDLSGAEFQCFCRDVWDWSDEFQTTTQIYGGGKVWCRTGTDPDSIVGITNVRAIWGDEAGLFDFIAEEGA